MTDRVNVPQGHMSINAFADISQSDSKNIGAQVLDDGSVVLFAADKQAVPKSGGDTNAQQTQAKQFLYDAIETSYGPKVAAELFSHGSEGGHLFSAKPLTSEDITTLTGKAEELVNKLDTQPNRPEPKTAVQTPNGNDVDADNEVVSVDNEPDQAEVTSSKVYAAISKFMDKLGELFDKLAQRAVDSDEGLSQDDLNKLDKADAVEWIQDSLELDFENESSVPTNKQLEDATVDTLIDMMKTNQDDGDEDPVDNAGNDPEEPVAKNESQSNDEISYPKLKPRLSNDNVTPNPNEHVAVKEELEIEPKVKLDVDGNTNDDPPSNLETFKKDLIDPLSGKLEALLSKAMNSNVPSSLDPPSQEDNMENLTSMGLDVEKTRKYLEGGFDQLVKVHGEEAVAKLSPEQLEKHALAMVDELFGRIFSSNSDDNAASELPFSLETTRVSQEQIENDLKDLEEAIQSGEGKVREHVKANLQAGKEFLEEIETVGDKSIKGKSEHSFIGVMLKLAKAKAPENIMGDDGFTPYAPDKQSGISLQEMRDAVKLGFARQLQPVADMTWQEKHDLMIDIMAKRIALPPDPSRV